jgi:tetratricopeptide (TPR) repeat protein
MPAPSLILTLLLSLSFSLGCLLQAHSDQWFPPKTHSGGMMQILFGDARRLFANQLFVKADIYFHNGYYPSLFDQGRKPAHKEVAEATQGGEHDTEAHEKEMEFLGQPKDWIDRLGRNFFPSTHSHLDKPGSERELLPWLRLSAQMDPHRVETYTVAGYWLRTHLNKVKEAEEFLREGWLANPDSYQILIELGRLYDHDLHDSNRARNLWQLALKKWSQQESGKSDSDIFSYEQTLALLGNLEEREGNLQQAIDYLSRLAPVSPDRTAVEKQIADLKNRIKTKAK